MWKDKKDKTKLISILKTKKRMIATIGSFIIILGLLATFLVISDCNYYNRFNSIKGVFSFYVLGSKPAFYYLDIEKNGQDYRLKKGDTFEVSYKDEFIVKNVSTDDILGRKIRVDVEGIGDLNDYQKLLQGISLVDLVLDAHGTSLKSETVNAGSIKVIYDNDIIAAIEILVRITSQDWLRFAKDTKNIQMQIDYLKKAASMNKEDVAIRKTLAALFMKAGMKEQAISQYQEVLTIRPNDYKAIVELTRIYLNLKEYDKAINLGLKYIKENPKEANAYTDVAHAYILKGDFQKAIENYTESLRINPDDIKVRLKLGEALEQVKNFKAAAEQYKIALTKKPGDEYVKIALANVHLKSGNYDESIKLYKDAISKQPQNALLHANIAVAYGQKGLSNQEIEHYKKSISLNPKDKSVQFSLAAAYEKRSLYKEAANIYENILKATPWDVETVLRLANLELNHKRYDRAIKLLEKVLKTAPNKGMVHASLGFAYGEQKKYKKSAEHYEKAIKQGIKEAQIHYNLAVTYDKLGKKKESIGEYEKYVSYNPTIEVLNVLADYYVSEKLYSNAINTYKKLIDLAPKNAGFQSSIAFVYGLMNNLNKEIEHYKISLKYDPEDDQVHLRLGNAYEKKGMYKEALESYKSAYELNPELTEAARKIPIIRIKIIEQKHASSTK